MKYIVITSKHHDGFALFGSKASPWNVVDATPFKRDVLKELAAACAKAGMPLGFYYSQAQDWHEPNGAGNEWDFGPDDKKDFDRYLREKAEPQVRELLTGYGPVALVWFDTPRLMTPERAQRFTDLVRSLQPKCLIDGRLGAAGDYVSTGDNVIPSKVGAEAWETPATINHTWGYKKDDHDWKSPGDVTFKLVDIVSKGGNYLLNVGPMADGVIPQPSQDTLRDGGALAEGERRGRLRRGADALRRGARRAERHRGQGHPGQPALPQPQRVPGHHEARPALPDALPGAARAVRAPGHEERGEAGLPARRRAAGRGQGRGRPDAAAARAADRRPDGHGDRGRDRGRPRRALTDHALRGVDARDVNLSHDSRR